MRPDELPDVSEVENFDATKLKRVKTKESNVLPTKEGTKEALFINVPGKQNPCSML